MNGIIERKLNRVVDLKLEPGPLYKDMLQRVHDIITDHGVSVPANLAAYDWTKTHSPRGQKMTSVLAKLLKKANCPNVQIGDICNSFARSFSPAGAFRFQWGNMAEIGNGHYEEDESCFGEDSSCNVDNSCNRRLLEYWQRGACITFAPLLGSDLDVRGRCLVHFRGGRRVMLFNFYQVSRGQRIDFAQLRKMFVAALQGLVNVPAVTWGGPETEDYCLGIYYNDNASRAYSTSVIVDFGRTWLYEHDSYVLPCTSPTCEAKKNYRDYYFDQVGARHKMACCEHHVVPRRAKKCQMCGQAGDLTAVFYAGGTKWVNICPACVEDKTYACEICGDRYIEEKEPAVWIGSSIYACPYCGDHEEENDDN